MLPEPAPRSYWAPLRRQLVGRRARLTPPLVLYAGTQVMNRPSSGGRLLEIACHGSQRIGRLHDAASCFGSTTPTARSRRRLLRPLVPFHRNACSLVISPLHAAAAAALVATAAAFSGPSRPTSSSSPRPSGALPEGSRAPHCFLPAAAVVGASEPTAEPRRIVRLASRTR